MYAGALGMRRATPTLLLFNIHTNVDANIMEEGKKEKRQEWPSGLYPVANRGLKGSWTDHSSTKDGRNHIAT